MVSIPIEWHTICTCLVILLTCSRTPCFSPFYWLVLEHHVDFTGIAREIAYMGHWVIAAPQLTEKKSKIKSLWLPKRTAYWWGIKHATNFIERSHWNWRKASTSTRYFMKMKVRAQREQDTKNKTSPWKECFWKN